MTSIAHTASAPRLVQPRTHLRAYLAGTGATAALTSGALVVFLSVATFVGFKGLPFGGSSHDAGAAYLGSPAGGAPTAAATALAVAPGAVAKHPITGSHGADAGRPAWRHRRRERRRERRLRLAVERFRLR